MHCLSSVMSVIHLGSLMNCMLGSNFGRVDYESVICYDKQPSMTGP